MIHIAVPAVSQLKTKSNNNNNNAFGVVFLLPTSIKPSSPDATPWPVTNKPEVSDVTCGEIPRIAGFFPAWYPLKTCPCYNPTISPCQTDLFSEMQAAVSLCWGDRPKGELDRLSWWSHLTGGGVR